MGTNSWLMPRWLVPHASPASIPPPHPHLRAPPNPTPQPPCREAEFTELECRLTAQQVAAYDAAATLWAQLREALVLAAAGGRRCVGWQECRAGESWR